MFYIESNVLHLSLSQWRSVLGVEVFLGAIGVLCDSVYEAMNPIFTVKVCENIKKKTYIIKIMWRNNKFDDKTCKHM